MYHGPSVFSWRSWQKWLQVAYQAICIPAKQLYKEILPTKSLRQDSPQNGQCGQRFQTAPLLGASHISRVGHHIAYLNTSQYHDFATHYFYSIDAVGGAWQFALLHHVHTHRMYLPLFAVFGHICTIAFSLTSFSFADCESHELS